MKAAVRLLSSAPSSPRTFQSHSRKELKASHCQQASALQPPPSTPLSISILALRFLTHTRDIPAVGPLWLLHPHTDNLMLGFPSPPLGLSLECRLSEACSDLPFANCKQRLLLPQNFSALNFLPSTFHPVTHPICFLLACFVICFLNRRIIPRGQNFLCFVPAISSASRTVPGTSLQQYLLCVYVCGCPPPANTFWSFLWGFLQGRGRLFRPEVTSTGSSLSQWDLSYKHFSSLALQMVHV